LRSVIQQFPLPGDIIAVLPNRNRIFLAGSDDELGMQLLAHLVEESMSNEPDPMCPVPIRRVGHKWATWIPPQKHPTHETFKRLERMYLFDEYQNQKERLTALHEVTGEDVFVASYMHYGRDDGSSYSIATWKKGVVTLLPKAEYIGFVEPDSKKDVLYAAWDNVTGIVGHMMTLDEKRHPPRWYVDSYPSDRQLKQMGAKQGTP
jgi:hypothetical protein